MKIEKEMTMDLYAKNKTQSGYHYFRDLSKYKLGNFISEYEYYINFNIDGYYLCDVIRYYKRLAEIVVQARRELTVEDFEKFCKIFDMERGSAHRRKMFNYFSAFEIGELRDP
jgi:hypothetical protein